MHQRYIGLCVLRARYRYVGLAASCVQGCSLLRLPLLVGIPRYWSQAKELDMFHPMYHASTQRDLYTERIENVLVPGSASLLHASADGLIAPLWLLENVSKEVDKVTGPTTG